MESPDSLFINRRFVASLALGSLAMIAACQESVSPDRVVLPTAATQGLGFGSDFGAWSAAVNVQSIPGTHVDFNTVFTDGCPFEAPDGKTFYIASNRSGNLDIWVATRSSPDEPWGEPVNVAAVNSTADDFCPTMSRDGHTLYFVSRRSGGCGGGDVYVARRFGESLDFETPELLPCDVTAPYDAVNSPFDEFSPFPVQEPGVGPVLYFSSFRPGGFDVDPSDAAGDSDIYRSASHGGVFASAELVLAINTTADDGQPNVGSDGVELFFYSTRAGGVGAADIYVATRDAPNAPWSTPTNLGPLVNSSLSETRPSLSWDGTRLYFGSTRAGGEGIGTQDIYVSTRRRLNPSGN